MSIIDKYNEIFKIYSDEEFEYLALEIAKYQFENCEVYKNYCNLINKTPFLANSIEEIPFLPIEFFRTHQVLDKSREAKLVFKSSSTTNQNPSQHFIANEDLYIKSFISGFEIFYGKPSEYCFLALLPSYLERGNSSLVYMFEKLIKLSTYKESNFFINDFENLDFIIKKNAKKNILTILVGVSYALLDFVEHYSYSGFKNLVIMETGGMKGKRKEILKEEMHKFLVSGFGVSEIHSEYGMTELLSQAYSKGKGIYKPVPWMKVLIRDINDPLTISKNLSGAINIIDLANLHSCSFIATQDMGVKLPNNTFILQGRLENSQIRGCNLMYEK
ncbi:MAG: acyl transferase [Bacteroidota bacterium]